MKCHFLPLALAVMIAAATVGCGDGHDYDIKTDGTNYYLVSRYDGYVFHPYRTMDEACMFRDSIENPSDAERAKRERERSLLKEQAKSWRTVTCD